MSAAAAAPPARLRPLEAAPFERGARPSVRLRDPLGVSPSASAPGGLELPAAEWELARRFDGARAAEALAREQGLDPAGVRALAARLSAALLLDDAAARARIDAQLAAFRALPARPPAGPGRDYPLDPLELRIAVGGLVADDWDMPAPPGARAAWTTAAGLRRGAALYARTWAALRHAGGSFARVLLLGAARAPLGAPLVPLPLRFDTPLGALARDDEVLALLPACDGPGLLAHRGSLVLERHALFLRLLFPKLPVAPALVSAPADAAAFEPRRELAPALEALRAALDLPGGALVLAAADLAELASDRGAEAAPGSGRAPLALRGAGSGEGWLVTGSRGEALRADDAAFADALTRADADALGRIASERPNPVRSAALPLAWLLARLLEPARVPGGGPVRGSLLGYLQMPGPGGLLSGASVLFH